MTSVPTVLPLNNGAFGSKNDFAYSNANFYTYFLSLLNLAFRQREVNHRGQGNPHSLLIGLHPDGAFCVSLQIFET